MADSAEQAATEEPLAPVDIRNDAVEPGLVGNTVEHGEEHYVNPTALGLDGTAWVALAMIAVIALALWQKVPAMIAGMLDKRIAAIRDQLDAATRLRAEAEALKAEYEAKAASADADAAAMREGAAAEAQAIVAQAGVDATALIARRTRLAEDKIAAAERAAVAEVRARVAGAAAAAAAKLIAERLDALADRALVDQGIGRLG